MALAMERCSWETVCEVAVGIVENASPSCYNIDDGTAVWVPCTRCKYGRLAQLVRALPSHGRGQRFKSFVAHQFPFILSHRQGKQRVRKVIRWAQSGFVYLIHTVRIGASGPLDPPLLPEAGSDHVLQFS